MDDPTSPRPAPPLDAWDDPAPAEGFADRMMARLDREVSLAPPAGPPPAARPPGRRPAWAIRPWQAALAGAALATVVLLAGLALRGGAQEAPLARVSSTGSLVATAARSTHRIGDRGVAVAETGASLSWQVDVDGNGVVTQQLGAVFYRVEHEDRRRFAVMTPQGRVVVTGTCFTVVVLPTSTTVQVHEGSVQLHADHDVIELLAGERARLTPDRIVRIDRIDDLTKDRGAASSGAHPEVSMAQPIVKARPAVAQPRLIPDAATLAQWAEKCHVRADMPPFEELKPKNEAEWEAYTRSMGGTAAETEAVEAAFTSVEQRAFSKLHDLYVQTTGDKQSTGSLTLDRMLYEIARTAEYQEELEIYQKISAERAGLGVPPPLDQRSNLEVLLREILAQGDAFETELARRVGPVRARQLREHNQGWPGEASEWEGCPRP
jgi:ferric-dicitrate binding protein FerR (iron transport regulator)